MESDVPTRALSVLIVTRNSASRIGALLAGIRDECERNGAEVIVLDNASHDGTPDRVWREHPWVFLRRSLTDLGFAAAANLASCFAEGRVLLLLHPDALPAPGCITQGLALLRSEPGVAVAGGALLHSHDTPAAPARRGPAWLRERLALHGRTARQPHSPLFGRFERPAGDAGGPVNAAWVSGPFLFVRTEAFRSLSGFDERFFLYYEEIDLCRRARDAGWRVCHCPALQARPLDRNLPHEGPEEASDEGPQTLPPVFDLPPQADPRHGLWHLRSSLLYHRKHHGGVPTWIFHRLERGWQALQAWRGCPRTAQDARQQLAQLRRAWDDTFGGRVCPPRPW